MIIKQSRRSEFIPIIITLESEEEAQTLLDISCVNVSIPREVSHYWVKTPQRGDAYQVKELLDKISGGLRPILVRE